MANSTGYAAVATSNGEPRQTNGDVPSHASITNGDVKTNGDVIATNGDIITTNGDVTMIIGDVKLQRTLGLFSATTVIIGSIIGSGIFVSPKGVLLESGSVGSALLLWAACGVITLLGALSFAELGTLIPSSGGMYNYIQAAFGDLAGFIYIWVALLIMFPAANAAIALTFAEYIVHPIFPDCESPEAAKRVLAAGAICLLTWANCSSVQWATRIQNVFTVIKVLALALIILTGIVLLCMGRWENFENVFEGSSRDPGRMAIALYSGLFSYSGWYTLNFLVEELKNPYVNLPRAIWFSMPLVTFIYVMANVAYFTVLTPAELLQSDAVAVSFAARMYSYAYLGMPVLVACSTFGSLNGCLLSVARLFFVAARQGHLPSVMAMIHVKRYTPIPSLLFQALVSLIYLFAGDIYVLINYVSFVEALAFFACASALLVLRRKWPNKERPIKVQLWIPVIFLLVCLFLVVFPIIASPYDTGVGIAICVSGVPVYILGIKWKNKPVSWTRLMARLTALVQKLCMCVPEERKQD